MARDLDFGIDVVGARTVREADGLAMSSRNARLSAAARAAARCVPAALDAARLAVADGAREAAEVRAALAQVLAGEPRATLEYAVVCDPSSLEPVARIEGPVQLAVAVWVDGVRLIDNVRIDPAEVDPARLVPLPESRSSGLPSLRDSAPNHPLLAADES
jgi:pantoate--beta-alanine ligase